MKLRRSTELYVEDLEPGDPVTVNCGGVIKGGVLVKSVSGRAWVDMEDGTTRKTSNGLVSYHPTPELIASRAAQIRRNWSETVANHRWSLDRAEAWTPPEYEDRYA